MRNMIINILKVLMVLKSIAISHTFPRLHNRKEEYMNTYTVEFRIEGSSLIPSNITKILELTPSQTENIGESINPKRKNNALWSYNGIFSEENFTEQKWETLEEGLLYILEKLQPKANIIQNKLNIYKRYLWCGHFQESFSGGPKFSPELLKKLAEFNTELILSNYCSD